MDSLTIYLDLAGILDPAVEVRGSDEYQHASHSKESHSKYLLTSLAGSIACVGGCLEVPEWCQASVGRALNVAALRH
jgi:hypothetical protein